MFQTEDAFLNSDSRVPPARAQRLSVLILLLVVALMTTSCGMPAQASGTQNNGAANNLNLQGNLPVGAVSESYNAVLAVGGGSSPYHFSVKTGALPPGISLDPRTGRFYGTPTAAGTFSFEVIVTDSPQLHEGSRTFAFVVGDGGAGSIGGIVKVSVSPSDVKLFSNQQHQFTASVSGTSNTGVTWSAAVAGSTAAAGSVDANGLYTAPAVNAQTNVVVTATSNADSSKSASAAVKVHPVNKQSLKITTGNLPQGQQGNAYSEVFTATGGPTPYSWSISAGTPPAGITMNANGDFAGVPSAAGIFNFTVTVTDAANKTATGNFSATIIAGSTVKVSVSPASVTLFSNGKQQFTASVSGTSNTGVTWSAATAGSVDANGLYTAPAVNAQTNVVVTATSNADSSKSAGAAVTVNPVNIQALKITTGNLPQGQQGNAYSEVFTATGGTTPYSWKISAGTPPAGIAMNANGDFAGVPTAAGTSSFTATVTDAANKTATGNFSATIIAGSNFDGPAELPRVTVPSAMADTPAPGSVIPVNAGGDLQSALNNANCGDVIQLQAGATFSGKFIVPAKNCDINHWIIVRTSAPDSALPAEGQRATPCYAGVASLPGRPQYSCANPKNVMAKVQIQVQGTGPFMIATGANYYRFIGLEITRPAGTPGPGELMFAQGTTDHLVVDRSWLHGGLQDETRLGVNLTGATNAAVVDSYFSDFHCISTTGTCTDSHAVSGGVSNTQDGPFKIQNNFLESSGEGILFGGGAATKTPTDIQILNNHFWKPWQWMPGSPNFIGGTNGNPFIVKNHLELKNAVRVLVEGNLMENCWGGFSQTGYGILLTPKNSYGLCPLCQVTDVTIRYVHISHGGGGISMATVLSGDGVTGFPALAGARWSIHDVVIDDITMLHKGNGTMFQIMNNWLQNPVNSITINHVTAFPDPASHIMTMGNVYYTTAPMYGLVFSNNLVITGRYPVWNTGGITSCAYVDVPVTTINKCFTTFTFSNNALAATPTAFPPSTWPANNLFPATTNDVGFVNYNNGNGGNYELQANSPYTSKGTDGKDLGADIVGLNAALANVE